MPRRAYHEALWEGVPEGLVPAWFDLRRAYLLARIEAGQRVLDVGCGEGRFAAELADAGASVVGVDVAEEPLQRGRERRADLDLRMVPDDGGWPFEDGSFDAVWAGEVIEHVADTVGWLSELRRVLRSGGRLLLSTPNHDPVTLMSLALRPRSFAEHFDPLSDHLRFYTRGSLARVLRDFGFEQVTIDKAGGHPGARRLLLASARRARW
jgi:2-polyprenyl-3-methyl-5-hydroxy-6-metoxy-1,4-benzoquinol methylase